VQLHFSHQESHYSYPGLLLLLLSSSSSSLYRNISAKIHPSEKAHRRKRLVKTTDVSQSANLADTGTGSSPACFFMSSSVRKGLRSGQQWDCHSHVVTAMLSWQWRYRDGNMTIMVT
jgi:hypothetical protein